MLHDAVGSDDALVTVLLAGTHVFHALDCAVVEAVAVVAEDDPLHSRLKGVKLVPVEGLWEFACHLGPN